jgi:hypothetical protein
VNSYGPTNPVVVGAEDASVSFGNYCTYNGVGARTIGYYKTHTTETTALLPVTLYGTVTVTTYTQVTAILVGATSKDANVMLKAQLLGAVLNVKQSSSFGTAYIPQYGETVNQIIADAQAFLVLHGSENLTKASANRTTALALETKLDAINNSTESNSGGITLIMPTACSYTFGAPL